MNIKMKIKVNIKKANNLKINCTKRAKKLIALPAKSLWAYIGLNKNLKWIESPILFHWFFICFKQKDPVLYKPEEYHQSGK